MAEEVHLGAILKEYAVKSQITYNIASTFNNWGIPTAHNLAAIKQLYPHIPIIATGGIRNGLTVAKAIAIGAQAWYRTTFI